jgi:zinc D-Ala-D-Ala dipeptidase
MSRSFWLFFKTFFFFSLGNASGEIVLITDPRVLKIPIQDNQDSLIDLRNQTVLVFGPSPEIPNNTDYTKMRKSVYDRLVRAQSRLPKGYKFCLYEAYRSLALQEKLFSGQYKQLQSLHPD